MRLFHVVIIVKCGYLSKELKDSNTLIKKLENLEGVEFVFSETRYRICIDIGKCFDEERVIDSVRKAVLAHFHTEII